ncbi:uncharacterized protein BJX67DRAFT_299653 [Aspergillus lucknowensis]|uniref:Uncharacterized protein n=1 Tax=Aspergillus lucknowensis TaxID=176173 RepID=A0ABR4LZE3_9EURO
MPLIRPLHPLFRSFLRINPPSRSLSHSSNLRYVKVKRPWSRRLLTNCLIYGAAIYAWSVLVLVPSGNEANSPRTLLNEPTFDVSRTDKTKHTKHEKPRVANSDAIFIPLGWPQLREGELYAESDPEWKAFVEISKDREKIKTLKDELASMVLTSASRSRALSRTLGPPFTVSQSWLIPIFPTRAPSAYHRSGLEITEAGVSWCSRPMSNRGTDTLHRSIRPLVVALAVKDAYLVLWRGFMDRFNGNYSDNERALRLVDSSTKTLLPSDSKALGNLEETPQSEPHSFPSTSYRGSTCQSNGNSRPHPSIILSILQRLPLPKFGPGSDLYAASLAFKKRLNERQARGSYVRHRDTFTVSGPVGLKGSMGSCRVEVKGEYDPKTSRWVSVSMRLKDGAIFRRNPLGGK